MPRPATAVVRVSRGDFDSGRFAEVQAMTEETGSYLVPAISKLADHLSRGRLAQGARRADGRLKQMILDARADAEKVGVNFIPIVNYPVNWTT